MKLSGKWKKISTDECGKKYPGVITFKENGLYEATADTEATVHPVWDVGTFAAEKTKVQLSTSNDAVIAYEFSVKEKLLTIKDKSGCVLKYQKVD